MSNILFRDQVQEGNSVIAEGYSVESINVFKNGETEPLDIKALVQQIIITEDINRPFIEVNMLITDASNRLENLRLNGNEKVEINIERGDPDVGDFSFHSIDDLRIAEISGLTQQDVKRRSFSIRCVSEWMYINASKALIRPFEGTIGKVINDICTKDLGLGDRDDIYISESTKGIVKGIFTHQRPIQAINWLMRNAFEDKSPFFFFATTAFSSIPNRLNFISLKELIADAEDEPHHVYDFKPLNNPVGPDDGFEVGKYKINQLGGKPATLFGQLSDIQKGAYASTLETLDIATKKYERKTFKYDSSNLLNEHKPFSTKHKIKDQNYEDLKDSRTHFVSLNTKAFDQGNYHQPLDKTLLDGISSLVTLDANEFQLIVPGNHGLHPSQIIELNISKTGVDENNATPEEGVDEYMSGNYLVTRVESIYKEAFKQKVTVKRNSVGVDIDA